MVETLRGMPKQLGSVSDPDMLIEVSELAAKLHLAEQKRLDEISPTEDVSEKPKENV